MCTQSAPVVRMQRTYVVDVCTRQAVAAASPSEVERAISVASSNFASAVLHGLPSSFRIPVFFNTPSRPKEVSKDSVGSVS